MFFCFVSVFLPLFSFISIFFFGNFVGYFSKILIVCNMFLSLICILVGSFYVIFNFSILSVKSHFWIKFGGLTVQWGFVFDNISVLMIAMVCVVSLCVHIYSCYYMSEDPHLSRFLSYLSLFTFFMLFLLISDNLIQIFCAWEGVGLCSYLLINFWFTRIEANKAALKAVFVNRVGDYALFFSIALTLVTFKTTELCLLNTLIPFFITQTVTFCGVTFNLISVLCLGFSIAAFCKSAQIGFHIWLPDAMEGPTPVSALIHAATMVTAGIYLILRCSFFFEHSPFFLEVLLVVGSVTALLGASAALFQYDIKKIIAYSTCSQLGYMFVACGLSRYDIALFHLINHAFFKAALFLSAGVLIHTLAGEQDIRRMGGLRFRLPLLYTLMLISSLALAGTPFFAGFYSKDAILGNTLVYHTASGFFAYTLCLVAAFCTSAYSFKLLWLVFWTTPRGFRITYLQIHSAGLLALLPIFCLVLLSIFSGFYLKDFVIGIGSNSFDSLLCIPTSKNFSIDFEFLEYKIYKWLPIFAGSFGFFLCWYKENYRYWEKYWVPVYTHFLIIF